MVMRRLGVFLLSLAGLGCGLLDSTDSFVIRVDSISAPASIALADTLTARFFGSVGSDGCSRLERVEKRRDEGLIELRFHGTRKGGVDCIQMPVSLDHEERIVPPLPDPFTIRVLQPDGAPLERVVGVQ